MKKVIFAVMLLGLFGINAYADEAPAKTVIILDASGSMWGQINGKAKIQTAKEALKDFVKDWDEEKSGELGITVYGHRKKKSCNDIESIIPVGHIDEAKKAQIYKKIKAIQPKGKTPIGLAIKQEAKKLKESGAKVATIILISDGIDSCNADPCKIAKKLVKEGVKIKIPVIAFDVDKKAKKQLQCIADATDSIVVNVDKKGLIKENIEAAIKPIQIKAEDDNFEQNVISKKTGGKLGNILLNDMYDGKPADAASLIIQAPKQDKLTIDDMGEVSVEKGVKAGKYSVTYTICDKRRTDNCKSAKINYVVKDLSNTNIKTVNNGQDVDATYSFFTLNEDGEADRKLDMRCSSKADAPCMIDLPKGDYVVVAHSGDKMGDALIHVNKEQVLKESDVNKIVVDLK